MQVFKFGGASVNSAKGVRNVAQIIARHSDKPLVVVVSAMGKMTNALEDLLAANREKRDAMPFYNHIRNYHLEIVEDLFPDKSHRIYSELEGVFYALMNAYKLSEEDYDFQYDQMVGQGEMLSSKILSYYLQQTGVANQWVNVKTCISTDSTFREGNVNWHQSEIQIRDVAKSVFSTRNCLTTQGFLGGDDKGRMVTLGREGSDYSAAIFAYCLNAENLTIWKDVPGFLNADPRYFKDAKKLDQITYSEAIELAYYGATIIHPKSIKPLQNRRIPLIVKSFNNPEAEGSVILNQTSEKSKMPCYICKPNQVLISIYPKDFSFIAEQNLSYIFFVFAENNVKINLIQNSAVSFTVCVDENKQRFDDLIAALSNNFKVRYNNQLELLTIRHYGEQDVKNCVGDRTVLLEQRNRTTAQLVVQKKL
ncbi:MAG: aspartate kinase [Bacteroidales bacterium]|jgi:aspartate kinase|nr:aspartate kinase [Bacteroidales bacterium]